MQCDVHRNPAPARVIRPISSTCRLTCWAASTPEWWCRRCTRTLSGGGPTGFIRYLPSKQAVVMATHLIAAIRRTTLGARVASLADQRDVVIDAIDVLLAGV